MTEQISKPLHPAATILLLRDNPNVSTALEVMMVKRHHEIDFASGALVFPGGKVSPGDYDVSPNRLRTGTHITEEMLPFALAAIRECFEECGVLLAVDETTNEIVSRDRARQLAPYRPLLDRGEISLGEFTKLERLILLPDRLVHFAHWVGPKIAPKRFDTHFFLAAAPTTQLAVHDGRETVDSLWVAPVQALEEQQRGRHTIIFPTRCNLEKLSRSQSVSHALDHAARDNIITVEPWLENRDGGTFLCIPTDAGYAMTAESIDTAFK